VNAQPQAALVFLREFWAKEAFSKNVAPVDFPVDSPVSPPIITLLWTFSLGETPNHIQPGNVFMIWIHNNISEEG
jgi:hypothetical protein